jgi:TonB family protein
MTFVITAVNQIRLDWSKDWIVSMWRRLIAVLLVLLAAAASSAFAQDLDTSHQARAVVRKVAPIYPDLARRLRISGVVKLRATIAPNGSVKLIEPVGGNPVLIKAAQEAVGNWKYAAASEETRELIELHFNTPN